MLGTFHRGGLPRLGPAGLIVLAIAFSYPAGAAEKPRIAVKLPSVGSEVSDYAQRFLDLPELAAQMERSLLATRKFSIVTRDKDKLKAILKEQEFAESSVSTGNAAQAGKLEAADYQVLSTVRDFVFYRSVNPVPNISNKYTRQDSGRLVVDAQVLDNTTGQVKFTFSLRDSFVTAERVVNTKGGAPSKRHFTEMAKAVSAKMADQLIAAVFPMVVLKVDGGTVWINRGQDGGLESGDTLHVFRPGETLVDPYTNETLGSAERKIGEVTVKDIRPKFSVAKIDGKPNEPIKRKDILRKP